MGCASSTQSARPTNVKKPAEAAVPQMVEVVKAPAAAPVVAAPKSPISKGPSAPIERVPTKPVLTKMKTSDDSTFSRSFLIVESAGQLNAVYDVEERKIGQGGYGSVSKATNKSTKQQRAVKTIPKSRLKDIEAFKTEVNIMKELDHPNIIRLFESFEDQRNVYLVMTLCTGGELFDRLIELGRLTEVQAAIIMQQIIRAVFYMHENSMAHRDLKPENFLFVNKDPIESAVLKVIDFGLSCKFKEGEMMTAKAGTPYYVSPQVLQGKYDKSCDLWSCGVIMFIMLCGYPPFYGDTDAEVLAKVKTGNFAFNNTHWKTVSEDAKDLIRRMLKMNPAERITAQEALAHVWVKNKAPKATHQPLGDGMLSNLKSFKAQNKLKKAALQVIAQQLPESEIAQLKQVFGSIDVNGDGKVTVAEALEGVKQAGLKNVPAELEDMLKAVDSDGSGVIDYTEFIAACLDKRAYIQEDRLWSAFRVFDSDNNGKISKAELSQMLAGGKMDDVCKRNIDEILKDADKNADGEIDFQEFAAMMKSDK